MEELVKQITEIITKECNQIREEFKQEIQDLKQEIQQEIQDLKQEVQELRDCVFAMEYEYGRKIDAMFDVIMIEQEKNLEKADEIRKLDKRMDRNEMSIFNHEKRITVLEKGKV